MTKNEVKILLVDDLEMTRALMRLELTRMGYRKIEEAAEGMTALTMLEMAWDAGEPYSMIISDWNMPERDGLQLLKLIRSDEHLAGLPFIMLTAEGEMESVMTAIDAGATDYLVKPISPEALAKKMQSIMEKIFSTAA